MGQTRIAGRRGGKFPDGESLRAAIPDAGISEEGVRGRIRVRVEYLKSIQVRE